MYLAPKRIVKMLLIMVREVILRKAHVQLSNIVPILTCTYHKEEITGTLLYKDRSWY